MQIVEMLDVKGLVKINNGLYRSVYNHPTDPDVVIKVAEDGKLNAEVLIWETYPELRDYLCPVLARTECGRQIHMRRLTTAGSLSVVQAWQLMAQVEELPSFRMPLPAVWDLHSGNFGVLDGRVVLSDYAPRTYQLEDVERREDVKFYDVKDDLIWALNEVAEKVRYCTRENANVNW